MTHEGQPHVIPAQEYSRHEDKSLRAIAFPNDPTGKAAKPIEFEDPTDLDVQELRKLSEREGDPFGKGETEKKAQAKPAKPVPKDIQKILDQFKDVFPEALPPGLPPSRPTDHAIDLLPETRPPRHRVCGYPKAPVNIWAKPHKMKIDRHKKASHAQRTYPGPQPQQRPRQWPRWPKSSLPHGGPNYYSPTLHFLKGARIITIGTTPKTSTAPQPNQQWTHIMSGFYCGSRISVTNQPQPAPKSLPAKV